VPQHIVVWLLGGRKTWSLWLTVMLKMQEDYYGDVVRIQK
jgi:hypothetical protein